MVETGGYLPELNGPPGQKGDTQQLELVQAPVTLKPLHHSSPAGSASFHKSRKIRRSKPEDVNLLALSKLNKVIRKIQLSGNEGTADSRMKYADAGHKCWSTLRMREWQEFQRDVLNRTTTPAADDADVTNKKNNNNRDGTAAQRDVTTNQKPTTSAAYFANASRGLSTRGSKRTTSDNNTAAAAEQAAAAAKAAAAAQRAADFQRVDDAYERIKMTRQQRRRDVINGVATEGDRFKTIEVKVINDDESLTKKQRRLRRRERNSPLRRDLLHSSAETLHHSAALTQNLASRVTSGSRENHLLRRTLHTSMRESRQAPANSPAAGGTQTQDCRAVSRATASRATNTSKIKPTVSFPKPEDFVPERGHKIDRMGVDWRYSSLRHVCASHDLKRVHSAPTASMTSLAAGRGGSVEGNLSSAGVPRERKASIIPVTEALQREGMSVSKRKGKVIERNEINSTKFWKRKLTNIIIPIEMARKDISEKLPDRRGQKKGKVWFGEVEEDDNEEDVSAFRQSLSRGASSSAEEASLESR